ncbi:MAG: hypothetical protein IPG91_14460 [Ideonella sp.]|nr:hypothetical protein [Ideonella sp.]
MLRSYLILNITDFSNLPILERWLLQTHAAETLSQLEPILERYVSYRAVPPPPSSESFCPYNWRMTEHWWRELPFRGAGLLDQGTSIAERWPENYTELLGIGGDAARTKTWQGSVDGGHPPVFAFVDYRPSEDFKGKGMTMDAGPSIRWLNAVKYPAGVSLEEGERWYLEVHAPEVCRQPGLKRFFSSKTVEPRTSPFVRISELWYDSTNAWRNAVIDSPPPYTAPPWARDARYPFLQPGIDFVSQFLLEAPTDDFKRALRPYLTTS